MNPSADPLAPLLEYRPEGLYTASFEAYLDPHVAVPRAILTHAHADHAAAGHGEVWATEATLDLYRLRHPEFDGTVRALAHGEEARSGGAILTLHPAGHVLGSAQVRIEQDDVSLLFTGDFKRQRSRTAGPAEAPRSQVLVTETTFGLPVFRFPDRPRAEARLVEVCREAFDKGETPVLLAYVLGKTQDVALALAEAGIPTVFHGAAWKLLPAFERSGFAFPLSRAYESGPPAAGEALVVPPPCARTPIVQKIKRRRVVYLSGWATREASRADFDADVLLPFSDHADFPSLLAHVAEVSPERVVAMHGYASDFARILEVRGISAWALADEPEHRGEEQ
jgi:Cft2 family RNA processing exonuclease